MTTTDKPPFKRTAMFRQGLFGALLGTLLLAFLWLVEAITKGLDPLAPSSIIELHIRNPVLLLLLPTPVLFATLFGWLGRHQDKLINAANRLEMERRLASEAADQERAWVDNVLDNAADCFITFEDDGRITRFNKAAEELFGYRRSEVIGRNISSLLPDLRKNTSITSEDWSQVMREDGSGGIVRSERGSEVRALLRDGTYIPCEVDLSKFLHGDRVVYTAIARDISERKRNERLERMLRQVTEAVNSSQTLGALYESLHKTLRQIVDARNLLIALTSDDARRYRLVYTVDSRGEAGQVPKRLAHEIIATVLSQQKPTLVNADRTSTLADTHQGASRESRVDSWIGVPLMKERVMIGVVAIYSYNEGAVYSEKDLDVLAFLSTQIAAALERETNREALQANERRYRRMIEEAGDIVYTVDVQGIFTYVNPRMPQLTGYTEQELIGRSIFSIVREDRREEVAEQFRRQGAEGLREVRSEFPIVTRTGRALWIEQNSTLLTDNGQTTGYQAIVHDITERRNAQKALQEREERFRSLSASSPMGILQIDRHDECQYANQRFLEITGAAPDSVLGRNWMDVIHPDERETFRLEWIFSREESGTMAREVRVQRPNGEIRWVNFRWTATLGDDREVQGFVATVEDITRRKHTERINHALYEISQAAQNANELDDLYSSIHRSLEPIIDTTNFYIARYIRERGTIAFPYARENKVENLQLPEREVGRGLTGYVIRTGEPLLANERDLDRLYKRGDVELIGKPARIWLGVPLISKRGVIGVVVLQSYTDDKRFNEADLQTMRFVSAQIATAIERKQTEEDNRRYMVELAEAHRRIKDDLQLAARIQQSRLPQQAPPVSGVEFDWLFNSCDEVAGDMFNFIQLDDHRVGVYILDVSGHGVPAALLSMALSRSMTASPDGSGALIRVTPNGPVVATPGEVAAVMNDRYPMNLEINQYFTFIYGILDISAATFTFIRAGHPAPVLIRNGVAREVEGECGPAIGIIPEFTYTETVVPLEPGDRLLLFTDGVEEAADPEGEEFGITRTLAVLSATHEPTVGGDIKAIHEGIHQHTRGSGQSDDITIVGFKYLGTSASTAKESA